MDNQISTQATPEETHDDCSVEGVGGSLAIGQWYWVQDTDKKWNKETQAYDEKAFEWLGCVMEIGSNYLELRSPHAERHGYSSVRVHFDDFWTELRFEPNPEKVIQGNVAHFQQLAGKHLAEVQAITARLGVSRQTALPNKPAVDSDNSHALVTLSGQSDIKQYENALILAKEKQLPELFEAIKSANEEMARWMTANTLPLKAMAEGMKSSIGEIDDRIFNVSLYAGLTEQVVKCCDGEPAAFNEKLHVMQRRLYMDEECLLDYRHGGMDFQSITEFNEWISLPHNRDRILPFPRCLAAMRVRRVTKERDWDGKLMSVFVNIRLEQQDKLTFLYIRNGDQVYCLSCDLDFDEMIFPDLSDFNPTEPQMVRISCGRIQETITRADYESRVAKQEEQRALDKQWKLDNPKEVWDELTKGTKGSWEWASPYHIHHGFSFNPNEWKPFDPSSVYFDDASKQVAERIKKYNRIALIIQGLFDRSEVLHPHPPVKTWTPEGFEAAVHLVYDGGRVLYNGQAPDFDAYWAKCNESLGADSVVIGQELYWTTKEAEKESRRLDGDWRNRSEWRPGKHYKPHGNPGPGYLAKMLQWKARSRQAVFAWNRERQTTDYYAGKQHGDPIRTTITVPADQLFNVSAYQLGDFKQFFRDPRTRAQYLKWAPMLLSAEEYHVGKKEAREPVQPP